MGSGVLTRSMLQREGEDVSAQRPKSRTGCLACNGSFLMLKHLQSSLHSLSSLTWDALESPEQPLHQCSNTLFALVLASNNHEKKFARKQRLNKVRLATRSSSGQVLKVMHARHE